MSSETNQRTACIVCSDADNERQKSWVQLLISKFDEVYVISSKNQMSVSSEKGNKCDPISNKSSLPKSVSAAFIHSSDANLWIFTGLTTKNLFQFTTPGTPSKAKLGGNQIYRKTSPKFEIYPEDIEETVNFITGQGELPRMCIIPNPNDSDFDPHRIFGYEELKKAEDVKDAKRRILEYLSVVQKKFKPI